MYSEEDLSLIRRMGALVEAGIPAAQAAEAIVTETSAMPAERVSAPAARHPVLPRLFAAASNLDAESFLQSLTEATTELGWTAALDEVVMPLLEDLGAAWAKGDAGLAHEHFASSLLMMRIWSALESHPPGRNPVVLLACPEDERHELPLLALALALAEAGVGRVYLGADVPPSQLVDAAATARVAAVCLVGTTTAAQTAIAEGARALIAAGRREKLFVGGAAVTGAGEAEMAPGIRLPATFKDAAPFFAAALSD